MVIERLKNIYREARRFGDERGLPSWIVFCDSFFAKFLYGMTKEEYFYWGCGAYSAICRSKIMTPRKSRAFYQKLNDKDYVHYFLNKEDFNTKFSDFIHRGWLSPSHITAASLQDFLSKYDKVLTKPVAGVMGKNIGIYSLDGRTPESEAYRLVEQGVQLEECVQNVPEMAFGASSLNTFRVYTLLDRGGEVRIVKVLVRIGVGKSVVDNFHAGGVCYPINLECGKIESCGYKFNGERVSIHPGIGKSLIGFDIPRWEELKKFARNAAKVVPQVRWVGWDIALTPKGFELIEGNHDADPDLLLFGIDDFIYQKMLRLI